MARGREARPLAERFWEKVDRSAGPDACWPWTSATQPNGYGYFMCDGDRYAHRLAYTLAVGPIPAGLQIDHLCRNRGCVNPAHLEPVTPRENVIRGVGPSARNAKKTHCQNGHEFTEENTYRDKRGHRLCRICQNSLNRANQQRYKERHHAERAAQGRPVIPNGTKTHCLKGHPLSGDNLHPTFLRRGQRQCWTCFRESSRAAARRQRERRKEAA